MANVKLKNLIISALEEIKGQDISCLDVVNKTDLADYMIIVTGSSVRHVKALTNSVISQTAAIDIKPLGIEGYAEGEWVLIDLTDVIVHVMQSETRDFYNLERLWGMADLPVKEGLGRDQ
ncbi:MAG: ribosome silencing factor [Gammaproteobacteria bacterium]|nr:ribosome silencing factor [Gammaproteobacteria bacterium]